MFLKIFLLSLCILPCIYFYLGQAAICVNWGDAKLRGHLDHKILNEASGLAVSSRYADRLYHMNDSGGGPFFYSSKIDGTGMQKIAIEGFSPVDVEDLALGPCGEKARCLFLGDIGDNKFKRLSVTIVVVEEQEKWSEKVTPRNVIRVIYPDRPHNAEALAVHPNGDLFIVTKEVDAFNQRAAPAGVYRLARSLWEGHKNKDKALELEFVGALDFPYILYHYNLYGRIITSFDFSADGKKALFLTYATAVEMQWELEKGKVRSLRDMRPGKDFKIINISKLLQQEGIAYLSTDYSFLYSTEQQVKSGKAQIMGVSCQD